MSDASKCDRCGSFYEPYKEQGYIIMRRDLEGYIDLCPVCADSFRSWLTLRPKEAADEPKEEQSSGNDNI